MDMIIAGPGKYGDVPPESVFVAACDARIEDKRLADFVCIGMYDEVTFERANRYALENEIEYIRLSQGSFFIGRHPDTDGVSVVVGP